MRIATLFCFSLLCLLPFKLAAQFTQNEQRMIFSSEDNYSYYNNGIDFLYFSVWLNSSRSLFSYPVDSEQVKIVETFDSVAGWQAQTRYHVAVYANDGIHTRLTEVWDSSSNLWQGRYLETFYYLNNDSSKESLWTQDSLNPTGNWVNHSRRTSTYNANSLLIERLTELYIGGTWSPTYRNLVSQYTASGKIAVCTDARYIAGAWLDEYQHSYTYNAGDSMIWHIKTKYVAATASFSNYEKYRYAYRPSGKIDTFFVYQYNVPPTPNAWYLIQFIRTYNAAEQLLMISQKEAIAPVAYKWHFLYNSAGNISSNSEIFSPPVSSNPQLPIQLFNYQYEQVSGIVANQNTPSFRLFPNPATNFLDIKTDKYELTTLQIYDIVGRLLYQSKLQDNHFHIDINSLAKGRYMLVCTSESGSSCQQFLKN